MNKAEEMRCFLASFKDKVVTAFLFERLVELHFGRAIQKVENVTKEDFGNVTELWISGCKSTVDRLGHNKLESFGVDDDVVAKIVEEVIKKLQKEDFWVCLKRSTVVGRCPIGCTNEKNWIVEIRW